MFLKAMKENRDDIISSFNASMGNLSRRIEDNSALIATNAGAIRQQTERAADHRIEIEKLTERVQRQGAGHREACCVKPGLYASPQVGPHVADQWRR